MTVSFEKLLAKAVQSRIPDQQLFKLFNQLNELTPVSEGEFVSLLENTENHGYLVHLTTKSSQYLQKFWQALVKVAFETQLNALRAVQQQIIYLNTGLVDEFIRHLGSYTHYLIDANRPKEAKEVLFNQVIFILEKLISNFSVKENDIFKMTITKFVNYLFNNNFHKQYEYCNDKLRSLNFEHHHTNKIHQVKLNNIMINYKSKNYHYYEQFKIFLWLNSLFAKWQVPNNEKLLQFLTSQFVTPSQPASSVSGSALAQLQCEKLIYGTFHGMYLSSKLEQPTHLQFCWNNFLLARLPKIIATTKIDSVSLEEILIKVFGDVSERLEVSLLQVFIKSLMFNKVLSIKSFGKIFPGETKTTQQTLIHDLSSFSVNDNFHEKLNEKLINVNCEFTSLEESRLVEYLDDLAGKFDFSMERQEEFSTLIKNTINDLISDASFEKLNRFLLALLNNNKLFTLILFNYPGGAIDLLGKLIALVDNSDSFKINDDNENSFQDFYAYFGTILSTITHMVKHFHVDDLNFRVKNSFVSNYINNFEVNLGISLTSNVSNTESNDPIIVENYNNLLKEWINSLFDEGGVGLSDDLIKSIEIKQIFQLVPLIYQQAIIATVEGAINLKTLIIGLEYLTQNFLIPCNLSIVNWLLSRISVKSKNIDAYLSILYEIVKLIKNVKDESSSETSLLAQVLLSNFYQAIYKCFDEANVDTEVARSILNLLASFKRPVTAAHSQTRSSSVSGYRDLKQNLIKLFHNDEDVDYELVDRCLSAKQPLFKYFIEEIDQLAKSNNNESAKYFIDFIVYAMLLRSICSEQDKTFWINQLENNNATGTRITQAVDKKFFSSMDYHYSSIFNTETKSEEDEADDLFNDSGKKTNEYKYYFAEVEQKSQDLVSILQLIRAYNYLDDANPLGKTLTLIHDKLLTDLKNFTAF